MPDFTVSFKLEGDAAKAIDACRLTKIALDQLATAGKAAFNVGGIKVMVGDVKGLEKEMRGVAAAMKELSAIHVWTILQKQSKAYYDQAKQVRTETLAFLDAQAKMREASRPIEQLTRAWQRLREATHAAGVAGALATQTMAKGLYQGSFGLRAGGAQLAQMAQGAGIGFRMSGIALGGQLAGIDLGTLLNPVSLVGKLAGVATIGAEMGVRLVSSVAGGIVKAGGAIAKSLFDILGSAFGDIAGRLAGGILGPLFGAGGFLLKGAGNVLAGVTNLAGEIVGQVGNVFTGIAEAARGAFQGVVKIAGDVLGGLVGIASDIVEKVAGVLGTLGKAVGGTILTIGGFALHDMTARERGLAKAEVLLDRKLTPAQHTALQSWARDLGIELGGSSQEEIGRALRMAVTTGLSGNLPLAKKAAEAGARLAYGTEGDTSAASEVTRTLTKAYSLYAESFKGVEDPFKKMADETFNALKYGDLTVQQLSHDLATLVGPAKAVGVSFEQLLSLIVQASRAGNPEMAATGLRRLLMEPFKLSAEQLGGLKSKGIDVWQYTATQEAGLAGKVGAVSAAEAGVESALDAPYQNAEQQRRAHARIQRQRDAIRMQIAKIRSGPTDNRPGAADYRRQQVGELQQQDIALQAQMHAQADKPMKDFGKATRDARTNLKDAKKELHDFDMESRNVVDVVGFFDKLNASVKAGKISLGELSKIIPDLRAFSVFLGTAGLDPGLKKAIEESVKASGGAVQAAVETQKQTIGSLFGSFWASLKAPFDVTLVHMKGTLATALTEMASSLKDFGKWWQAALEAPGAGQFVENLRSKFTSLIGGLHVDLKGLTTDDFWAVMNKGLDKVWDVGTKVVGVMTTLGGLLGDIVGGIGLWGPLGDAMKKAFGWLSETVVQLSEGDTSNLVKAWDTVASTFKSVFDAASAQVEALIFDVGNLWEDIKAKLPTSATLDAIGAAVGVRTTGTEERAVAEYMKGYGSGAKGPIGPTGVPGPASSAGRLVPPILGGTAARRAADRQSILGLLSPTGTGEGFPVPAGFRQHGAGGYQKLREAADAGDILFDSVKKVWVTAKQHADDLSRVEQAAFEASVNRAHSSFRAAAAGGAASQEPMLHDFTPRTAAYGHAVSGGPGPGGMYGHDLSTWGVTLPGSDPRLGKSYGHQSRMNDSSGLGGWGFGMLPDDLPDRPSMASAWASRRAAGHRRKRATGAFYNNLMGPDLSFGAGQGFGVFPDSGDMSGGIGKRLEGGAAAKNLKDANGNLIQGNDADKALIDATKETAKIAGDGVKVTTEGVGALTKENADLKKRLADLEKTVASLQASAKGSSGGMFGSGGAP